MEEPEIVTQEVTLEQAETVVEETPEVVEEVESPEAE